jgi:hypothetical protein
MIPSPKQCLWMMHPMSTACSAPQVVLRVIAEEMSASSGAPPVIKGAVKDLKALFKVGGGTAGGGVVVGGAVRTPQAMQA